MPLPPTLDASTPKRKPVFTGILACIALCLGFCPLPAQQSGADHFRQQLQSATTNSERAHASCELAFELLGVQPDSAKYHALKAISFATPNQDDASIDLANNVLGLYYRSKSDCNLALDYFYRSREIRQKTGDKAAESRIEVNIGGCLESLNRYMAATQAYLRADSLCARDNLNGKAMIYNSLGGLYRSMGNWEESLHYLEKGLALRENSGDEKGIGQSQLNLANLFNAQDNYKKAKYHYHLSLKLAGAAPTDKAAALKGLSVISLREEKLDSALMYCQQSLEIYGQLGDSSKLAGVWINRGLIYDKTGDTQLALLDFERAASVYRKLGIKDSEASALNNMARIQLRLGKAGLAEDVLLRALALEAQEGSRTVLLDIYRNLSEAAMAQGKLKQALRYSAAKDSLDHLVQQEGITASNLREEIAQAKQQAKLGAEEMKTQRERNAKERLTLGGLLILAGLFVVIAFMLVLGLRVRNRALNAEKAAQQVNLHVQNLLVEQGNQTTQALLTGIESERKRISAELHDSLQQNMMVVKIRFDEIEKSLGQQQAGVSEHFLTLGSLIDESIGEVRRISHNLDAGNLSQYGLQGALEHLAKSVSTQGGLRANVYVNNFPNGSHPSLQFEHMVYLIVSELVGNVLRHADAKVLDIQLSLDEDGMLLIETIDDGRGFDIDNFTPGLGLRNIQERVQLLGGEINIDSSPGKGTTIQISVPIQSKTSTSHLQ